MEENKKISILGLTEERVNNEEEILAILQKGIKNRSTSCTLMNR
jgi:hypothetical protein